MPSLPTAVAPLLLPKLSTLLLPLPFVRQPNDLLLSPADATSWYLLLSPFVSSLLLLLVPFSPQPSYASVIAFAKQPLLVLLFVQLLIAPLPPLLSTRLLLYPFAPQLPIAPPLPAMPSKQLLLLPLPRPAAAAAVVPSTRHRVDPSPSFFASTLQLTNQWRGTLIPLLHNQKVWISKDELTDDLLDVVFSYQRTFEDVWTTIAAAPGGEIVDQHLHHLKY